MQVKLLNVRLAFPVLWAPEQVNGQGKAAYSVQLLMARGSQQAKLVEETIAAVAKAQAGWGAKALDILKQLKAKDALCLHDGDLKEYDGYAGNLYVSARSEARPLVIDRDRSILSASDGRPYSGCYVNAIIDVWAQDNKFGRRVNAGLKGIQFCADGEAFSSGSPARVDDFDSLDASESEAVF